MFTQDDLMTGLGLIRDGYNESLSQAFVYIRYWKYVFSLAARLVEGSVGLAVSFLLIITSETVVDLVRLELVGRCLVLSLFTRSSPHCFRVPLAAAEFYSNRVHQQTR